MGDDGKEYGPVDAVQIRRWIAEGRIEKKTPVKLDDARDWVFVQSLPEFKEAMAQDGRARQSGGKTRKWLFWIGLVVLAGAVLLAVKKFNLL
jgi:LPXTG-motif cell wall-anchored protein